MYPICLRAAVIVGFGIAFTPAVHAESKYNPYTQQWEDVSPNAYPQLNPITGKWELAAPGLSAKIEPIHSAVPVGSAEFRCPFQSVY